MAQVLSAQPDMQYRRSADAWSRLRAERMHAAVEKHASARQEPPQSVALPQETMLPAIDKEPIANTRFYRRVSSSEVMLSGDALVVNEAYLRARAKQALQNTAEAASEGGVAQLAAPEDADALAPSTGCETCEARRYQDGSDDSGVSFQSPGSIATSLSGIRVAAHEGEHMVREGADAGREGKLVTDKHVTMQMRFCPDCGRMYAAGGKTTIQTTSRPEGDFAVQEAEEVLAVGDRVDAYI